MGWKQLGDWKQIGVQTNELLMFVNERVEPVFLHLFPNSCGHPALVVFPESETDANRQHLFGIVNAEVIDVFFSPFQVPMLRKGIYELLPVDAELVGVAVDSDQ